MRIISKESDYYDIGLQYGIDPHIVWNRTEREVVISKKSKEEPIEYQALRDFIDCFGVDVGRVSIPDIPIFDIREMFAYPDTYIFAFCGKVYTILCVDKNHKTRYLVSKDEAVAYYKNEGYGYTNNIWESRALNRIEEWFDKIDAINRDKQDVIERLHIACNSPIIFTRGRRSRFEQFVVDANLKDMGFIKIKDPFTAFNELSQYVCNYLCNREPEMAQISDKDMSVKKGFNDKSFRKGKGE